MTTQKPQDDLSKEQILESIGRIVSEGEGRADGPAEPAPPAAEPAPAGADDVRDVLDLVDMVDEEGNVIPLERASEGAPAPSKAPAGERPPPRGAEGGERDEAQMLERLQPALRRWLDAHVPPLVERLARREIERAARRSEPE